MGSRLDAQEFGKRLKEARETAPHSGIKRITQRDLAERLLVSDRAVSQWEMGTKNPSLENLVGICQELQISADHLLGLQTESSPEKTGNGLAWRVADQPRNDYRKSDEIQDGIALFEQIVEEGRTTAEIQKMEAFRHLGLARLKRAVRLALFSQAVQIVDVRRDSELEEELVHHYPTLRQCFVPKVHLLPDPLIDSAVRPDIVALLAARNVASSLSQNSRVALTGGTTIARFVDFLPHGSSNLAGIKWIPMIATPQTSTGVSSAANDVVARMVYNQPGAEGYRLPFVKKSLRGNPAWRTVEDDERRQELRHAHEVLQEAEKADSIFISVGSPEFNYGHSYDYLGLETLGRLMDNLNESERDRCCGDILLRLVDVDGMRVGNTEFRERNDSLVYSIRLESLKRLAKYANVWILAARAAKAEVINAALKAGYANSLVIDRSIADKLTKLT